MAKQEGKAGKKEETVKVIQDSENPEPVEIIAKHIIAVSEAFEKINNSKLARRAIVLLLHDSIPTQRGRDIISKKQIEAVLEYAPKLKQNYIKK